MIRSKLTDKFLRKHWEDFERDFKRKYKEENNKSFQGSVAQYVTSGVVKRKGLPDVEDVTSLMKIGLFNKDDETIDNRLNAYFEDEENKARGYAGAFCDICKDLTIDIPIHPQVTAEIMNMEEAIAKKLEAMNQLNKVIESLGGLKDKLMETQKQAEEALEETDELGVDNKDTQEDK